MQGRQLPLTAPLRFNIVPQLFAVSRFGVEILDFSGFRHANFPIHPCVVPLRFSLQAEFAQPLVLCFVLPNRAALLPAISFDASPQHSCYIDTPRRPLATSSQQLRLAP